MRGVVKATDHHGKLHDTSNLLNIIIHYLKLVVNIASFIFLIFNGLILNFFELKTIQQPL